jgi:hypothetical protein
MMHRRFRIFWLCGLLLLVSARGAFGGGYQQTNLVTSANDPDLINPWGISFSSTSPFWISDNGTGKSTLYNGLGQKQGLIVTMPTGSEPISGQVFNGSSNFNADRFIFASENGTIAGWRWALGTTAGQLFSVTDAVYKGPRHQPGPGHPLRREFPQRSDRHIQFLGTHDIHHRSQRTGRLRSVQHPVPRRQVLRCVLPPGCR